MNAVRPTLTPANRLPSPTMDETIDAASRAFAEIRELRTQSASALGSINAHLARIEGMVAGQVERSNSSERRLAEAEAALKSLEGELNAVKLDAAAARAAGAPLQRLAWAIITIVLLWFGGVLWTNANKPQPPQSIILQVPPSHP